MSLIFQTIDATRGAAGGKTTLDQSEANQWARAGEAVYYRHYYEELLSTAGPIKDNATGCALDNDEVRALFPKEAPLIDQMSERRRRIVFEVADRMLEAAGPVVQEVVRGTFGIPIIENEMRLLAKNAAAAMVERMEDESLTNCERALR